jgi:hypothetical protein
MYPAMYTNPPKNMYAKIGVGRGKIGLAFASFSRQNYKKFSFQIKNILKKF